jgi:hypothetical protein
METIILENSMIGPPLVRVTTIFHASYLTQNIGILLAFMWSSKIPVVVRSRLDKIILKLDILNYKIKYKIWFFFGPFNFNCMTSDVLNVSIWHLIRMESKFYGPGLSVVQKSYSFTLFYVSAVDYQIRRFILTHLQNY